VDYTSDDLLGFRPNLAFPFPGEPVLPEEKNNRSHYAYVGGKRDFSRQLQGAVRLGVQYTDYYNTQQTDWSPYVDFTGTYTYLPGSVAKAGLTVQRNATDAGVDASGELTLDQQSTVVYAGVDHRITSRINGSILGRYQHSIYNGGDLDGSADDYFTLSLNLSYKIREYVFADLGYSWWKLASSRPDTDFGRNRVYVGIRASY
jgi:hypothetical protein